MTDIHSFNICPLTMAARNDLNLEQKVNLIKDNERGGFSWN
jgi:hypothetical protein